MTIRQKGNTVPTRHDKKPSAKALDRFEADFKKEFGDDIVRARDLREYEVISTGSAALDFATGVGGLVRGRLYEYWGVDAIGKTTSALLAAVEYQKVDTNGFVGVIDMEHTIDKKWLAQLGLDTDRVYIANPSTSEDVADMMSRMLRHKDVYFGFIVLDSVGGMISWAESEKKQAKDVDVGTTPKVVTRMIKKSANDVRVTNTDPGRIVIYINQVRANIGSYGADIDTPGGFALKHGTTMKFHFRPGGEQVKAKVGDDIVTVGRPLKVKLDRNKVAPPYRVAEFVLFNQTSSKGPVGIDKADEAVNLGLRFDLIEQRGSWYVPPLFPDEKGAQGREALVDWMREHPESVAKVREMLIAMRKDEIIYDEAPELQAVE